MREEVRRRARAAARRDRAEFAPEHPEIAGRSFVLPVVQRGGGAPQAWLFAALDSGGLGDFERLILQQAVTVVALELMRQRAMRDTERRLAGDVLAEALTGACPRRSCGCGSGRSAWGRRPRRSSSPATRTTRRGRGARPLPRRGRRARAGGAPRTAPVRGDRRPRGPDPVTLARAGLRSARRRERQAPRGGVAAGPRGALRNSFHEARCALEAAALANGHSRRVASYRDLGAFQLILSLQDDEALRLYCDSVLGPLEGAGGEYGDELIRSLETYIEQNGQWERAARELYCHRHTLRYRIRRVEQLTGRDLSKARDRIEFWLALRGRELVNP